MAFLAGPYEHWIHGYGRRYLPTASGSDGPQFIAALAEGTEIETAGATAPFAAGVAMLVPTLWTGGSESGVPQRFRPVLLQTPDASACLVPMNQTLSEGEPEPDRAAAAAATTGLRLNMALPTASVDPAFTASATPVVRPFQTKGAAKPVLVAVIDDGMPVFHRGLRDSQGRTRVAYFWQQSGKAVLDGPVLFGREYDGQALDALMSDPLTGGDEDALYRHLQANEASANAGKGGIWNRAATHGAHVLDLAAGSRPGEGPLMDDIRVIAVQLPTSLVTDTTGFGKEALVLAAFHYIFDRADRIAEACGLPRGEGLPLVINLSYGFTGGPHDGSDRLEAAIRDLVAQRQAKAPTSLTLPAGNSFQSGLNGCADGEMFEASPEVGFGWKIQGNDRTANYLELWLKPDNPDLPRPSPSSLGIRIMDPDGLDPLRGRLPAPGPMPEPLFNRWGEQIGQISMDHFRGRTWRVLIVVGPSETRGPDAPQATPGLWTISLARQGGSAANLRVECRIQRDTDPLGHLTGGRQSVFVDWRDAPCQADGALAATDTTGAFLRRSGTLNGLATHDKAIVVGGHVASTGERAPYSSVGTGRPGEARVHCTAPSDESPDQPGRRAAGLRTGSSFRLVGTSTAAPQVARVIALGWLMQKDQLTV
jgi:hypothetical protein